MKVCASRRGFLRGMAAGTGVFAIGCKSLRGGQKIRLAAVGVMGKGYSDWTPMVKSGLAEMVAFCDADYAMREKAQELLKIFGLEEDQRQLACNLPYGKQRKLEIARALATNPRLLLLDEPAAGMNPQETAELTETIRFVRDKFDMTILLIEHDMSLVSGICEEITVLNFGTVLDQGPVREVLNNPEVVKAYLGD